jgi:ElaB/YqjD/DUF883 family membrane-anchored ribosome-binding protein
MSGPKFASEWDGFKGHVALTWDKISEDELLRISGNFNELVSLISGKYGETKQHVEERLKNLYAAYLEKKHDLEGRSQAFIESVRQKASDFQSKSKERYQKIKAENIDPAVEKSEEYIKLHPFTAVLGALGVGLLIGGLVGALSRRS